MGYASTRPLYAEVAADAAAKINTNHFDLGSAQYEMNIIDTAMDPRTVNICSTKYSGLQACAARFVLLAQAENDLRAHLFGQIKRPPPLLNRLARCDLIEDSQRQQGVALEADP